LPSGEREGEIVHAGHNAARWTQVDAMTQALLRWNMAQPQITIEYFPPYQISPI